jgi:Protein of unknown function (DUF1559)
MRRYLALFLVLSAALPAFAADRKFDADAKAKAVAPFVDERTVGVLHVDLDSLDVAVLMKKAELVATLDPKEKATMTEALTEGLRGLKKAGANEIYLILSLADVPDHGPFSVIPLAKNTDASGLGKVYDQLQIHPGGASEVMHGGVVIGDEATLKRLKKLTPTARPEIAKAFGAGGDGAVHFAAFATTDTRKVVEEMLPNLPQQLGGGSIKVLTRGLQWATLKIEFEPNLNVLGIVQTPDNASAKELLALLQTAFTQLSKDKETQAIVRSLPLLEESLMPKVEDDRLVLKLDEKTIASTVKPAVEKVRAAAFRMQSTNNLKQLTLAMHNYHDTTGAFPAVANFDEKGNALLSWRVHVLPYIDQVQLYKEFHLDEPWDSAHNLPLAKKMPKVFASSQNGKLAEEGKTTYLGIVHKSAMFTGDKKGVKIGEVTDGTSNTLFIVDADDDHAVTWTKPEDLKLDPKDPQKGLKGRFGSSFLAAFVDGSVRQLPKTISKETLNALFTRNGGEALEPPE